MQWIKVFRERHVRRKMPLAGDWMAARMNLETGRIGAFCVQAEIGKGLLRFTGIEFSVACEL
jgi:hypothetical protein